MKVGDASDGVFCSEVLKPPIGGILLATSLFVPTTLATIFATLGTTLVLVPITRFIFVARRRT